MKKWNEDEVEEIRSDLFKNHYTRERGKKFPCPRGKCIVALIDDMSDDDAIRTIYNRVRSPELRHRLFKDISLGRLCTSMKSLIWDSYLTSVRYVLDVQKGIPFKITGRKLVVQIPEIRREDGSSMTFDESFEHMKSMISTVLSYINLKAEFSAINVGEKE